MTSPYNDGSAQASAGAPPLPNLLNGYAKRTPWEVAGVDYAVGVPSGTALKDPATISMTGVSVNATTHTITVTGSNVSLIGYNFGLGGGWGIDIKAGANNTVVENSNFLVGANEKIPVTAEAGSGNLTLNYNTINGAGQNNNAVWDLIGYSGTGTFTAEYNNILNAPEVAISFGAAAMTTVLKYNLFQNVQPEQYYGTTASNSVEAYNTIYETNPSGIQGVQFQAQGGSSLTNTTVDNNTIVAKGPGLAMSYAIAVIQSAGNTINGATVDNNYIDYSGADGAFYPPSGSGLTFADNVNLSTGATIPSPSGTSSTPPPSVDVSSVTASPASGTQVGGETITFTLNLDQAAVVTGTPTLSLNDGGIAVYASGSGSSKLVFSYTVASSATAVTALGITAVNLPPGAGITSTDGSPANLTGAVTSFPGLAIGSVTSQPQPIAAADTASVAEKTSVSIAVLANDTAGGGTINPASVTVSSLAAHGTTSVNSTTGAITYTSVAGFYGTDSFKYTVSDNDGVASAPATVTVTVEPPPTGQADSATTAENQPVTIAVLANDSDPGGTMNPGSVAVSTGAMHGTTAVNAATGAITYTPASGFYGTDSFQYSVANTLNERSSPATVTVTVAQSPATSANPVSADGYVDGASGAPVGSPQLPTMLSGYVVRPPWEVAGVDYAVGVPSATTLLNPATISMSGVTVNSSTHTITVTGNNVTLSGYDFSLANGYTVVVEGANDTIKDSKFVVGSNQGSSGTVLDVTSAASNFSLLANEFDGNNVAVAAGSGTTVSIASSGQLTIQYNYFHNSGGDMVDLWRSTTPEVDTIQYNLFANIGVHTAHADTIQWYNSQIAAGSDIGFNTVYQNVNQPGPGNGGLVPLSEGPQATMTGLTVNNDTVVQTANDSSGNWSVGFYADMGGTASDIVIHDLYIDPTGVMEYTGSPWFATGSYGDELGHPTAMSNVTDMVTGGQVPVPSASSKTAQGYYVYADGSGYSPALSDVYSVTASPASGTVSSGSKIVITLNMDEVFTVTGTPTLSLNDGGTATYSAGSGTNALTFTYTVGAAATATLALAVTQVNLPGGATVKDSVGNAANLAGAVTSFSGLAVSAASLLPPAVTWAPGSETGTEGSKIALGRVTATASSGTTLQSLVVSGLPAGTVLSDGTNSFTATATSTSSNVTGWNLANLTVTPANDANFNLNVQATAQGVASSANASEAVSVAPLAPTVVWSPGSVTGIVGSPISLGAITDTINGLSGDNNTLQSLVVSGIPSGATLSDGTNSFIGTAASTSVNVAGWNLAHLNITPTSATNFQLKATATAQDAGGNTSTAATSEALTVNASSSGSAGGSTSGSTATPELPNLLSGYAARPSWKVAGVDYYVGVPGGLALKQPTATNLPAGATLNGQTITVTGNNVTLSGFDFSGNGGYGVYVASGASGTVISNNLFVDSSSSAPIPVNIASGASNTTVSNNTMNGGGANGNQVWDQLVSNAGNGLTVEYNYMYNAPGRFVSTGGGALTDMYNLFENGGYLPGVHLNFLQFSGGTVTNPLVEYNTVVQNESVVNGEGFQMYNNGAGSITNGVISNNTMISSDTAAPGASSATDPAISYMIHAGSNGQIPYPATGTVSNNYMDTSSAYGAIYPGTSGFTFSNNINMTTGHSY